MNYGKCNFCGKSLLKENYRKVGDYYYCTECGNTPDELEVIRKQIEKLRQ